MHSIRSSNESLTKISHSKFGTFCSYAITRLKQAPDDDLVLYLLQLVQALKYENFDDIEVTSTRIS